MAPHGTSKQYLVERLRRENQTALLAAVEAGKITALTAAVELGWVKRPPGMGGGNIQRTKRIAHQVRTITGAGLSAGQMMELQYGPSPFAGSLFASREELEQAWQQAREHLLEGCRPGRRVAGWWEFEATISYPGYGSERSVLWRMDLLSADERVTLETEWKAAFREAQAPDFTLNDGSGEILVGDCARRAHFAHHDIPRELIKRWERAERRRRSRAVRNLPAELQAKAPDVASGVRGEEENMGLRPDSNAAAGTLE
jgi:hypothetical protein